MARLILGGTISVMSNAMNEAANLPGFEGLVNGAIRLDTAVRSFLLASYLDGNVVEAAVAELALGNTRAVAACVREMDAAQIDRFEGLMLDDSPKQALREVTRMMNAKEAGK